MLRRIAYGSLALLLVGLVAVARFTYRVYAPPRENLPLPDSAVSLASDEGRALLERSGSVDWRLLEASFVTQAHGSFCGIASSVIALRALGLGPVDQDSFFDARTARIQTWSDAFFGGITLDQLGRLLAARGASTSVVHAAPGQVGVFRDAVRRNLARTGDVLIVNYDRRVVHEAGAGHISPIGAYDAATDRVLIVDTASYKYPPHWVTLESLYRALSTVDPSSGQRRGYVEVTKAP